MSYLPLTNNVGVNLALSAAMDTTNPPVASQQAQRQVIIVQAPEGTTVRVVQPPPLPIPEEKPLSMDFTVFIFMMGVSGVLMIVLSATRKAAVRKVIGAVILIPWVLFACYNLFSLARAG